MTRDVMQSLWVGPRLSTMERLCITSYMRNEHPFHLYVYDTLEGVPDGCVLRDAHDILPQAIIPRFKELQNFSDYFRYTLLWKRGNWWVDTDTVCLRPFDFSTDYVFDAGVIGYLKAPTRSLWAYDLKAKCEAKEPEWATLGWNHLGTTISIPAVKKYGLEEFVKPMEMFDPLLWDVCPHALLDPSPTLDLSDERYYAIHLFNKMWSIAQQPKDNDYSPTCLYEQLKSRYLR